jgi:pyruvate/2-oxoglutarate dehydrogenase complex dihydrolipoamide dehydrogenase (E3) component
MPDPEHFTNIVFGSGTGGKVIAWTLAEEGQRTAMVERKWIISERGNRILGFTRS